MTTTDDRPDTDDSDSFTADRENETAEATVNRNADGDPLGASLFLGIKELDDLGINVYRTKDIAYWVEDGELRVASAPTGTCDG